MRGAVAVILLAAWASCVEAGVKTENVEYRDGAALFSGYLAYDAAVEGKRPGILVVHEWWGLNHYVKRRAEQLAALGFVAFAADMYGEGRVTADAKQAGEWAAPFRKERSLARARARAALAVLAANPLVDARRIAAIGYCFGGTVVLELARGGEELAGVVSFHGGLDTPSPAAPGAVKARVLVLSGGDDPFVPTAQRAAFEDEMRKAGADWQSVVYGGARHAFTNPEADRYRLAGVGYHEASDRRSWEAMRVFFKEIFE